MKLRSITILGCVVLVGMATWQQGCASLKQMQDALLNLKRLQFKLESVVPGQLAGIDLSKANSLSSFSLSDGLKLTSAFANKSLPLSFTLNVAARNPNDGTGGSTKNTATLTSFAWKLKVDQQETVTGNLANPIEIPGTGQATIIPVDVGFDLFSFFSEQGYDSLINLALAVAGQSGSTSRLTMTATPKITVAGVPLEYPGELTIVDKQFTNP